MSQPQPHHHNNKRLPMMQASTEEETAKDGNLEEEGEEKMMMVRREEEEERGEEEKPTQPAATTESDAASILQQDAATPASPETNLVDTGVATVAAVAVVNPSNQNSSNAEHEHTLREIGGFVEEGDKKPAAKDDGGRGSEESLLLGAPHAPHAAVPPPQPPQDTHFELKAETNQNHSLPTAATAHQEWLRWYNELQAYAKANNGDCFVPPDYPSNPQLARWCADQRKQYALYLLDDTHSTMTVERIDWLERLAFSWNPKKRRRTSEQPQEPPPGLEVRLAPNTKHHDDAWMSRYHELVAYHAIKGDCLVPKGYKANQSLANWVKTQRRNFKLWQDNDPSCSLTPERIQLLEKLNFAWKVRERTHVAINEGWMDFYRELSEYRDSYGDCHVPSDFALNPALAQWVGTQRAEYQRFVDKKPSCLSQERVELLDKLSFHWRVADDFEPRFKELEAYAKEFGDTLVPRHYTGGLGAWCRLQRKEYKKYCDKKPSTTMTAERVHRLEGLAFPWKILREDEFSSWDETYDELKAHFEQHGDCAVARKDNERVVNWIKTQRKEYKKYMEGDKKSSSMTPEKIQLLEAINFQWSVRTRDDWMVRYDMLVEYKKKHGDCLVPKMYKENPPLGNWVATQRKEFKLVKEGKKSYLTADRIQLLNDLGFQWKVYFQGSWLLRFRELQAYSEEHGDVNVPKTYHKNISLGNWVRTQRREYKKYQEGDKNTSMTEERIQMLESLGFQWQLKGGEDWMTRYNMLEEFYNRHGHSSVPQRYEPNPYFGAWVNDQRMQFRNMKAGRPTCMTQDKIDMLERLEFEWNPHESKWMGNFERLKAYVEKNGHGKIPSAQEDKSLRQWCEEQRKKYRSTLDSRRGTLTDDRQSLLESLGFPFPEMDPNEEMVPNSPIIPIPVAAAASNDDPLDSPGLGEDMAGVEDRKKAKDGPAALLYL